MKRIVVLAAALLGLAVLLGAGNLFWPYGELGRGVGAAGRAERDLAAGLPPARERTDRLGAAVRRGYPELRHASYRWQEVRCSIEDGSAQLGVSFAQVCSLRTVWLVPVRSSRWDDCRVAFPLTDDGDATVVRARGSELGPGASGPVPCPDVAGAPRTEQSQVHTATDRARLVSGSRPTDLRGSPSWKVVELEVPVSDTEIGCRPALLFCASGLARPAMGGLPVPRAQ